MKMHPGRRLLYFVAENPLLLLLIVLVVVVQLLTGAVLNPGNLRGVGLDAAIIAIVAAPMAMLFIAGYIDFSVGSVLALSGVVAGSIMAGGGDPAAAIIAAIVVGMVVGLANAIFTTVFGLSAFVTTLGSLLAVRGVAQLLAPLPVSGFGDAFGYLGVGTLATVPLAIWIAVIVLILSSLFLSRTPAGRHVYAIGVSREAAYLSGIKVKAIPFALYLFSGAMAGLAGAITVARLNSAPAGQLGQGFELTVITAVLLGGVALTGGSGSIFGVLIGVLFLGLLNNALVLLNVPSFWQDVASGLALIAAIGLALVTGKLRQRLVVLEARTLLRSSDTTTAEKVSS
ncbi:ABC transporter permease [Amnibacterium flavum]|uniref:ABC transporter permease n=1 Tax=Amnibacterium flavum TaxID=2173173 RepID=A0A2V1HVZ7_9MICO|nr:ABC transporter permease [Amnibacterium flavum]PVZ94587.1 ABC transporter permease [Amnibacterium flavum]